MTDPARGGAWPVEIKINRADRTLDIAFDDGRRFRFTAEFLRVHSPSAEVRGHGAGERRIVGGCRTVGLASAEPVGNYAVRLIFDDGHDTGLYSWAYLRECGLNQDRMWRDYLDALAAKGLSRDRA
ncbi:MAG: DUF971 domain-containing protein [Alphaproteobacteria bacterium]